MRDGIVCLSADRRPARQHPGSEQVVANPGGQNRQDVGNGAARLAVERGRIRSERLVLRQRQDRGPRLPEDSDARSERGEDYVRQEQRRSVGPEAGYERRRNDHPESQRDAVARPRVLVDRGIPRQLRPLRQQEPAATKRLTDKPAARPQCVAASTASSKIATMLVILIIGLTAGPAVSL